MRISFEEHGSGWAWRWNVSHGDAVIHYELEWVVERSEWLLGTAYDDGGWNHEPRSVELPAPMNQQKAAEIAHTYIEGEPPEMEN